MDGYEEQDQGKRNLIIAIVAGAVLLLVVGIGVFVIIKRRAGEAPPGGNVPVATNVNGAGAGLTNTAPGQKEAPVVDVPVVIVNGPFETLQTPSTNSPPTEVDPTTNRLLTDEEKLEYHYPVEWTVRVRAVRSKESGSLYLEFTVESKGTDTDGDGLSERQERDAGTDPKNPDTDGDRLTDGDEVSRGTDPTKADTDGDGVDDWTEMVKKTLPPPPTPEPPAGTPPAPAPSPSTSE